MPAALPWIIGGGIGLAGGLWVSGATEQVSTAVKWAAIAGVVYIGAKAFKVI